MKLLKFLFIVSLSLAELTAEVQQLFRIQLHKVEPTISEKKQLFEFLNTHQNYFIDEDDPALQKLLNWQPPAESELDDTSKQINQDTSNTIIQQAVDKPTEDQKPPQEQVKSIETKSFSRAKLNLKNFKNTQYLGELQVGSNLDPFTVIYDTGSANMWINSKRCTDPGCVNHHQFDPFNSKTYSKTGFDLDVEFGTGGLKGFMGQDQVQIGGVGVDKQDFAEIVKEEGAVFEASKFDGIVGLAYPSMAAYGLNPIFDNIISQKKLTSNIFSFVLDRTEGSEQSQLILGGVDQSTIEGEIKWHKVVDKYYWMIKAEKILLNGKDTELCKNCNVIADTGTSLITGPTDELMSLLDNIQVDDNCNNVKSLPVLTFVIDGVNYDLTPHDYLMKVDNQDNEEPYVINLQMQSKNQNKFLAKQNNCKCTGAFMPLDIPEPQGPAWILGDIFLSKYVSAYNRDTNMVGFAKAKKTK